VGGLLLAALIAPACPGQPLAPQACNEKPHPAACSPPAAAWIERQQKAEQVPCSPLTNLPLEHLVLTTNRFMRSMIASMQPGAGG
jgi:hypothetical protein